MSGTEKNLILEGMECGQTTLPLRAVQIDWTDRCNLGCFFCSQRDVRDGQELDRDTLEGIFDQLDGLAISSVQVAGGGDPLFHREVGVLLDSIRLRHRFTIGTLVTNALGLNSEIRERVLRTVGNRLILSLNSFGEAEFLDFTGVPGGTHRRIVENIRRLMLRKRELGLQTPRVYLQYLIHDGNYRLMGSMLEQARELGVDALVFNPIHGYGEWSREIVADPKAFLREVRRIQVADRGRIIEDIQTVSPDLNRLILELRETEFGGDYPNIVARHMRYMKLEAHCPLPWYFMHIKATGGVYPCCFLVRPDQAPVGDVHQASLAEIWEGGPLRGLRENLSHWLRDRRRIGRFSQDTEGLPSYCTDGTCMIRHLPYIDDGEFYRRVDCCGRAPVAHGVTFPDRFDLGSPAEVAGFVGDELTSVGIRVNQLTAGRTEVVGGRFSFTFSPDVLPNGFHLIDVTGDDGIPFAAARVEKPRSM